MQLFFMLVGLFGRKHTFVLIVWPRGAGLWMASKESELLISWVTQPLPFRVQCVPMLHSDTLEVAGFCSQNPNSEHDAWLFNHTDQI